MISGSERILRRNDKSVAMFYERRNKGEFVNSISPIYLRRRWSLDSIIMINPSYVSTAPSALMDFLREKANRRAR